MHKCRSAWPRVIACLALVIAMAPASAQELSLQQAIEMAVKSNPTIASARSSSDAASLAAKGARALTNPEIIVAPSVVGDAGADSAVVFSQPLEINGSRRVRGTIAAHEAAAAAQDAEVTRRDIIRRVSQVYWEVALAQELVKLQQDDLDYLGLVSQAVRKQLDVGAVPGGQVLKMDVETARSRQELAQVQLQLSQSRAELNTLLNSPDGTDVTASDALAFVDTPADKAALKALALAKRPELSSAAWQLSAANERVKEARLRQMPDLAVSARRESFDSESDGGVALVLSLPVLDWGSIKADTKSAAATARSRRQSLEAVRNGVALDVEQAVQRIDAASRIVRDYRGGILEKSEQLALMARKGFEKGANSYLEVLEAQRTLRTVRSGYYSALAEHATALAQLEWATGCPVPQAARPEEKK